MSCEYQNCFGGGEYCLLKISKNTLNIWESNFVDSVLYKMNMLILQKMILGYVNTGITVQPGTGYIYQSYLIHRYKYIYIYTSISISLTWHTGIFISLTWHTGICISLTWHTGIHRYIHYYSM